MEGVVEIHTVFYLMIKIKRSIMNIGWLSFPRNCLLIECPISLHVFDVFAVFVKVHNFWTRIQHSELQGRRMRRNTCRSGCKSCCTPRRVCFRYCGKHLIRSMLLKWQFFLYIDLQYKVFVKKKKIQENFSGFCLIWGEYNSFLELNIRHLQFCSSGERLGTYWWNGINTFSFER